MTLSAAGKAAVFLSSSLGPRHRISSTSKVEPRGRALSVRMCLWQLQALSSESFHSSVSGTTQRIDHKLDQHGEGDVDDVRVLYI